MLKDLGYRVRHFIPRDVDVPFASSGDDALTVNIDKLIYPPPRMEFHALFRTFTS